MRFESRYWVPAIVWALVIFTLSAIPNLQSGFASTWDLILRKMAHMAEFGILAMLLLRAFKSGGKLMPQDWFFVFLVTLMYATSDEIHQLSVTGRHGSVWDIGIDMIGIGLGLLFYYLLSTQRKIPQDVIK